MNYPVDYPTVLQQSPTEPSLANVSLQQSVALCQNIVARYDRTFYWGSWFLPTQKRQAMWAVYAWFRQKDELIDSAQPQAVKQLMLNRWFEQLEPLFASGQATISTDIALVKAIQHYRLPMEPFRDMLLGQKMALEMHRYQTWEDLRLYCYRVAGTVGLVSASVLGASSHTKSVEALVTLGIAMQLTDILQDVGEDARRGQIYLPQEDLDRFCYTTKDLLKSVVDHRWSSLMAYEIQRVLRLYTQAQSGLAELPSDVRWPLWVAWILYRQDLKVIEKSGYQVLGDRPPPKTMVGSKSLVQPWWLALIINRITDHK